jgi:cell division septation protein DedD
LNPEQRRRFLALLVAIFAEERLRAVVRQWDPDLANGISSHVDYTAYSDLLVTALEGRGIRNELIDMLLTLPEVRGRQAQLLEFRLAPAADESDDCPYPGLAAYRPDEHARFFGRRAESGDLFDLLRRHRWLWVEGASGVGKSSLVAAGLLPLLGRDGPTWKRAVMRPGAHPVDNLARALHSAVQPGGSLAALTRDLTADAAALRSFVREHTPASGGFLLYIDQLEECRTFADPEQVRHFDRLIAAALDDLEPRFHLVTTIRIDQVGEFMARMRELAGRINEPWVKRYAVRPIAAADLRDVIAGPAAAVGRRLQNGLVEAILADVTFQFATSAEANLPILAHALRELWFACVHEPELSVAAYQQIGQLTGALTGSAEAALAQLEALDVSARDRVHRLLLALATVDDQHRWTRQTITRERALAAIGGQRPEVLLACLSGQSVTATRPAMRFVTTSSHNDQGRVDLIHEALLTRWATLKEWLAAAEDTKRDSDALHEAAAQWKGTGYQREALPGGLLREKFLKAAPSDQDPALDELFQEAMRKDEAAEAAEQRRGMLFTYGAIVALALLAIALGITAVMAIQSQHEVSATADELRVKNGALDALLQNNLKQNAEMIVRLSQPDISNERTGLLTIAEEQSAAIRKAITVIGKPAVQSYANPDGSTTTSSKTAETTPPSKTAETTEPPADAPTPTPTDKAAQSNELAADEKKVDDCDRQIGMAEKENDADTRIRLLKEAADCNARIYAEVASALRPKIRTNNDRIAIAIKSTVQRPQNREAMVDLLERAVKLDLDPKRLAELQALRGPLPEIPAKDTKLDVPGRGGIGESPFKPQPELPNNHVPTRRPP